MTSRELVYKTLEFNNYERVPRQLWTLLWAGLNYPVELEQIRRDFPDDIIWDMKVPYKKPLKTKGNPYVAGSYIDEWGCEFKSIREGYVGEVKKPQIKEEDWKDAENVQFPEELLTIDVDIINEYCLRTDKFIVQTDFVRPFERLQFLRGTPELLMDIALENVGMMSFLEKLHSFNCKVMEKWATTGVDALFMMDDWGSQNSLLINPKDWVRKFKPLYSDYCTIAKKHNKKIFMHSDGHTLDMLPHLIDIGVDAVNLQIFCIGLDKLKEYKGSITFWGEIDRQWILPYATTDEVRSEVKRVYNTLWDNGGCVAQCEFGPGAKAGNVLDVFKTWENVLN